MQEMWMSFWGERHGNHNESQSQTNIFRTPSNHLPSITLKYPIIATAVRERRSRRRSTDECVWPTHFILVLLLDCMFSDGSFDRHPATRKEPRETKAGRSAVLSTSAHQEDTECCGEPPFPWIISRVLRLLPTSTSDPQRSMDAGSSASIPPYAKQLAPMQTQNSRWHGLADAPLTTIPPARSLSYSCFVNLSAIFRLSLFAGLHGLPTSLFFTDNLCCLFYIIN